VKCPVCGCESFYLKDPEDEFETFDFQFRDGEPVFDQEPRESSLPGLSEDSETYCNRCAWHGKLAELRKA